MIIYDLPGRDCHLLSPYGSRLFGTDTDASDFDYVLYAVLFRTKEIVPALKALFT